MFHPVFQFVGKPAKLLLKLLFQPENAGFQFWKPLKLLFQLLKPVKPLNGVVGFQLPFQLLVLKPFHGVELVFHAPGKLLFQLLFGVFQPKFEFQLVGNPPEKPVNPGKFAPENDGANGVVNMC